MGTTSAAHGDALASFHAYLKQSKRVLTLLGAGLSASSGLPTFRGAGGLWRTHDSTSLATPESFARDPGLVWQFYSYRRHMALKADPNPAHYALAEASKRMPGFITLSQNVDGLSQRADHPRDKLHLLHGTLFEVRCTNRRCGYSEPNFVDPITPALAIPTSGLDPTSNEVRKAVASELDISNIDVPIPKLTDTDLPQCPSCKRAFLRPGVVWFGESLPRDVLNRVDDFIGGPEKIDLIMVIGTSARVFPAASYIEKARSKGARVCVVNMDPNDVPPSGRRDNGWFFQGDAAQIVPELLKPLTGDLKLPGRHRHTTGGNG